MLLWIKVCRSSCSLTRNEFQVLLRIYDVSYFPVCLQRQTGGLVWAGPPSEQQHLQSAPLCTEEASCFSTGGFPKPQCLMWAALNHTTCSLNMNYIHLSLRDFWALFFPPLVCRCFCWVIVQQSSETRRRRQWPWSRWSDFDLANPAIRLLREEWTSNPGWYTCVLCSPNVSLPPLSTSLSDGTQSEY